MEMESSFVGIPSDESKFLPKEFKTNVCSRNHQLQEAQEINKHQEDLFGTPTSSVEIPLQSDPVLMSGEPLVGYVSSVALSDEEQEIPSIKHFQVKQYGSNKRKYFEIMEAEAAGETSPKKQKTESSITDQSLLENQIETYLENEKPVQKEEDFLNNAQNKKSSRKKKKKESSSEKRTSKSKTKNETEKVAIKNRLVSKKGFTKEIPQRETESAVPCRKIKKSDVNNEVIDEISQNVEENVKVQKTLMSFSSALLEIDEHNSKQTKSILVKDKKNQSNKKIHSVSIKDSNSSTKTVEKRNQLSIQKDLEKSSGEPTLDKKNLSKAELKREIQSNLIKSDPKYKEPFKYGWKRELVFRSNSSSIRADVYYTTPENKKLKSMKTIRKYLKDHLTTNHGLTEHNFTFTKETIGINDDAKETVRQSRNPSVRKSERKKVNKESKNSNELIGDNSTSIKDSIGARGVVKKRPRRKVKSGTVDPELDNYTNSQDRNDVEVEHHLDGGLSDLVVVGNRFERVFNPRFSQDHKRRSEVIENLDDITETDSTKLSEVECSHNDLGVYNSKRANKKIAILAQIEELEQANEMQNEKPMLFNDMEKSEDVEMDIVEQTHSQIDLSITETNKHSLEPDLESELYGVSSSYIKNSITCDTVTVTPLQKHDFLDSIIEEQNLLSNKLTNDFAHTTNLAEKCTTSVSEIIDMKSNDSHIHSSLFTQNALSDQFVLSDTVPSTLSVLSDSKNITSDSMSVIQSIPRDQEKIENDLPCEMNPMNLTVETEGLQSKCVDEIDNSDTKSKESFQLTLYASNTLTKSLKSNISSSEDLSIDEKTLGHPIYQSTGLKDEIIDDIFYNTCQTELGNIVSATIASTDRPQYTQEDMTKSIHKAQIPDDDKTHDDLEVGYLDSYKLSHSEVNMHNIIDVHGKMTKTMDTLSDEQRSLYQSEILNENTKENICLMKSTSKVMLFDMDENVIHECDSHAKEISNDTKNFSHDLKNNEKLNVDVKSSLRAYYESETCGLEEWTMSDNDCKVVIPKYGSDLLSKSDSICKNETQELNTDFGLNSEGNLSARVFSSHFTEIEQSSSNDSLCENAHSSCEKTILAVQESVEHALPRHELCQGSMISKESENENEKTQDGHGSVKSTDEVIHQIYSEQGVELRNVSNNASQDIDSCNVDADETLDESNSGSNTTLLTYSFDKSTIGSLDESINSSSGLDSISSSKLALPKQYQSSTNSTESGYNEAKFGLKREISQESNENLMLDESKMNDYEKSCSRDSLERDNSYITLNNEVSSQRIHFSVVESSLIPNDFLELLKNTNYQNKVDSMTEAVMEDAESSFKCTSEEIQQVNRILEMDSDNEKCESSLDITVPITEQSASELLLESHPMKKLKLDNISYSHSMASFCIVYKSLKMIFEYLSFEDLLVARRVCKAWKDLADQPALWRKVRISNGQITEQLANILQRYRTEHLIIVDETSSDWNVFNNSIPKIKSLQALEFECSCPAFALEQVIKNCPQLQIIIAKSVTHEKLYLEYLKNMKTLKKLSLKAATNLSLIGDLSFLLGCTELTHLSLRSIENLGNKDIQSISMLINLQTLELGECSEFFNTFGSSVLSELKHLKRLRLEKVLGSCCNVDILGSISKLEKLETLQLINISISREFDECLSKCFNVKKLLVIPFDELHDTSSMETAVFKSIFKLSKTLKHFILGFNAEKATLLNVLPMVSSNTDCEEQMISDVSRTTLSTLYKYYSSKLPETHVEILRLPFSDTWNFGM